MPEQPAEQLAFSFGGSHDLVVPVSNARQELIDTLRVRLHEVTKLRNELLDTAVKLRDLYGLHHEDVRHWTDKVTETNYVAMGLRKALRQLGYKETKDERDTPAVRHELKELRTDQDELPLLLRA